MTSCLGLCAVPALVRLAAAVALVVVLTPTPPAQSGPPRFEPTACWWMVSGPATCGVSVAGSSCRSRVIARARPLCVSRSRSFARGRRAAPRHSCFYTAAGGVGGIRLYSEGVARGPLRLHRDVVIYDQRGAGFSQPKLCPAYDSVADARVTEARRACIAELEAQGIDRGAYNTAASVADLMDLRRALGYASWDVYGMSYGARIADATARHVVRRDDRSDLVRGGMGVGQGALRCYAPAGVCLAALPNLRKKLSWRGGRLKGKGSVLMAAAAPRSLRAIR